MLRRALTCIVVVCMTVIGSLAGVPVAVADCSTKIDADYGFYPGGDITVGVGCETDSAGSSGESGEPEDTDSSSGSSGCYDWDGTEVPCWDGDNFWSSELSAYCHYIDLREDSPLWDAHRDADGVATGVPYQCETGTPLDQYGIVYWEDFLVETPTKPGVDPVTVVESAVASLGLHAPTVGVGAFVYPGYEDWGLTWWVGAPMWLWVDEDDPLQWGSHTISASAQGLTITATATATSVTFDAGDGQAPVTCGTAGTVRPWAPDDLLSHHSPTKCEHTYMAINTLGDKTSRFTVSATVTWEVVWTTTDGQSGALTTQMASVENP
ncbi:MAG: hypothetical protein LBV00_04375, partial [Propionibacteriaceae bacterium]|nr:hypothetical protein [Propionibacteriaceae bacterium]